MSNKGEEPDSMKPYPIKLDPAEADPAPHTDSSHGEKKCSYCEALKVPADKRTGGMRRIIKHEKLQLEIGSFMVDYVRLRNLVAASVAHGFGVEEYGQSDTYLMKGLTNTVKALLLVDGLCCVLKYDTMKNLLALLPDDLKRVYSAADANKSVLQRARSIKTPLHMLAAIPVITTALRDDDNALVKRACETALRAIELNCADWHDKLQTCGICTKDVEVVLQVTLADMYCMGGEPPGMDYDSCHKALDDCAHALWRLDPGNAWGALYMTMVFKDPKHCMKVLRTALARAEERGDEGAKAMVLWEIAYNTLMGCDGPTFLVSNFLDTMKQAEEAHELARSWGYASEVYRVKRPMHMWRPRGVVAKIRADIRANPEVADLLRTVYRSEETLDGEIAHVRCDHCGELRENLLKCSRCQEAKYCSKECQRKHWVRGHKRGCKFVAKVVSIAP